MAWSNWPNTNHNSDEVLDPEYELLASPYIPNGVIGSPTDTSLIYADGSGRSVKSRANKYLLLRGQLAWSGSTELTYTIAPNTGATRIDLIVAQWDRVSLIAEAVVIEGTPGAGPPPLTRATSGTGVYQMILAQVTVVHGAVVINSADVRQLAYFVAPQSINCTSDARPPHAVGLHIYETDTTNEYTSDGAHWINPNEDTGYVALLPATGWTFSVATIRRVNGLIGIRLQTTRTGDNLSPNTINTIAKIPTGLPTPFVPTRYIPWVGFVSGDAGLPGNIIRGHVETDGTITIVAYNLVDTVTISGKKVLTYGASLLTGAIVVPSIPAYAIGGS